MNQKLVESLVQAIESLPQDDYIFFQQKLTDRSIQKKEGVCGGQARIRNTRIPVWTIISLQNQGASEGEILENYPTLTPFDLMVVQDYYTHNAEEINEILSQEEDQLDG